MNRFAWAVLGLCCAAPLGAEDVKVFTPSRTGDAPVYMNGEVVRIDRAAGTITLRSNGVQNVLILDSALEGATELRPGANVILGYRTTGSGRSERRIVSDVRSTGAAPTSTATARTLTAGTTSGARSIGTAQVVSVDAGGRRLTVIDSTGATRVLDVRGAALANLGGLRAGDQVSLGVAAPLVSGSPAGTVTSIGTGAAKQASPLSFAPRPGDTTPPPPMPNPGNERPGSNTGTATNNGTNTFDNRSLPSAPALPAAPPSGVSGNPAQTGVQPVPQAQPVPGVQTSTGVQPVPGAQPLPGTGATGQGAANPGLAPQPVPGAGGQNANNAGVTGGTGSVPQLGGISASGINSQIPSIPQPGGAGTGAVLPPASVSPGTNPPRTPAEMAAVRELGTRDFDMAAAVLGSKAAEVDRAWVAYRSACVTTTTPLNNRSREWFGVLDGSINRPTDDACEQSFAEVERLAQSIRANLDIARDAARRADVLPGRMREVLQRYSLDI